MSTRIGIIREGKTPPDTRVAFTPSQCAHILAQRPDIEIFIQPSPNRCFTDAEYAAAGVPLKEDLSDCDIILGIKEVPVDALIPYKTYLFFSHTKKAQPYNKKLMQALIARRIRMVDYECLTYADGQRILGFGFFAGLVGAHNGLLTYGKKWNAFHLSAAHELGTFAAMQEAYKELKLPNIKIVITGSGKVAAGALEVMVQLDVDYIEPSDFVGKEYEYPVYTHLKGQSLYVPMDGTSYHRDQFHAQPEMYQSVFEPYLKEADILLNGVYWDRSIPRLFEPQAVQQPGYRMAVISDITCDIAGSVSINRGASTIADPVYATNRHTLEPALTFQPTTDIIDIMAVDNLPNELPRDASEHFGQHLEKYILEELLLPESELIARATICNNGRLTAPYSYLEDYAYGA